MYLKSLEIQGFKSFPDKTVLTFGPGITGVVGPNGSGKSNIADAVRWVLGEQSTKSLRGSKMEDVIFSGTGARKAVGFAEVTLRLDNEDGLLQNPEKEVSVTRRYYRSGESQYLINGKAARLKDVNELFMDTGLGRDGYSMVSQGKIEDMVAAKSDNRREMFEEAAGISHYRYRRIDALRRLDQTEENLVRIRDIVGELKSRVGPLERQSVKAQEFLRLSAERRETEIGLWLRTLDTSAQRLREQSNRLDVARAQYDETGAALGRLGEEIESAADEIRGVNLKLEALRGDVTALEDEASGLDAEAAVLLTGIEHNGETAARIDRDVALQQGADEKTDEDKAALLAEIEALDLRVCEAQKHVEELTSSLAALKSRDEAFSEASGEKSALLAEVTAKISRAQVEKGAAASYVEEIRNRLTGVNEALEKRNASGAELRERLTREEARVKELQETISSHMNVRAGVEMKLKSAEAKLEDRRAEHENLRLSLLSLQSRLKFLRDTEKNMEGYGGAVKAVLRESAHGVLPGVRGTVFQLIGVDAQYATAIETALGGAVQDVVTETDAQAKKAIHFLKNTNAGRATFLPLSAVKGKRLDEPDLDDCFGFVGLACDLISYDPEYEGIMTSLLGRTAVCEDLDVGTKIARDHKYRFKIVTLDGQVIHTGGSMTGGSKINSAGFFTRRAEAERLEKEEGELERRLSLKSDEVKSAVEALSGHRAASDGVAADLQRAVEEKQNADAALSVTRSLLSENDRALEELQNEKTQAEGRIEHFTGLISVADAALADLRTQAEALSGELDLLSGGRDDLLSSRERLNGEMGDANVLLVSLLSEKQNKTLLIADAEKRREEILRRISELEAEKADLMKKTDALRAERAAVLEKAEAVRKKIGDLRETDKRLLASREAAEKRSVEARNEEKRRVEDREKLSAEVVRLEERKTYLEHELEDTERKLFEEYNLTRRQALELMEPTENVGEARSRLSDLKAAIKALGSVNVAAIDEYKEVSARYDFLSSQLDDVEKSKRELLKMIEELTSKMAELFLDRFNAINAHFRTTFNELFGGGEASLVLDDEKDILECGISIKAQPPGKNVKNLSLLSGGEKGLTAVALLFAILKVRPAPFCIFDEVEAALDDVNVVRYAQYVRMMTENTQFILITHRRGTMEEADILYGVTMQEHGVSKLLELKTAEMVAELKLDE